MRREERRVGDEKKRGEEEQVADEACSRLATFLARSRSPFSSTP